MVIAHSGHTAHQIGLMRRCIVASIMYLLGLCLHHAHPHMTYHIHIHHLVPAVVNTPQWGVRTTDHRALLLIRSDLPVLSVCIHSLLLSCLPISHTQVYTKQVVNCVLFSDVKLETEEVDDQEAGGYCFAHCLSSLSLPSRVCVYE